MTRLRSPKVVAAVLAVAAAGCGVGAGEPSEGEATLTVTRDYGAVPLLAATVSDPRESETVIKALDREAEITTRYGGGFVQAIEGVEGEVAEGRSFDWFFYVNGVESSVGAAEVPVRAGDRIWWDHRDWTDAMRVPAVVGSWPEPFAQASTPEQERRPIDVGCAAERGMCAQVADRLSAQGVEATVGRIDGADDDAPQVLVGPWGEIADDSAAKQLAAGPAASGVFAEPADRLPELVGLDERARPAARLGPGSGLVAAIRDGGKPATWLVTGTDDAGVEAAVELLDEETLRDHYAVATLRGEPLSLPASAGGAG